MRSLPLILLLIMMTVAVAAIAQDNDEDKGPWGDTGFGALVGDEDRTDLEQRQ